LTSGDGSQELILNGANGEVAPLDGDPRMGLLVGLDQAIDVGVEARFKGDCPKLKGDRLSQAEANQESQKRKPAFHSTS
jgi:hypothetical protein